MSRKVVVLDYGSGNIFSLVQALTACGADVQVTSDPQIIVGSSHLLIPGVGAFGKCRKQLQERGLDQVLRDYVAGGGWLLGICVGMQVLFSESEEYGIHTGLDILPGRVTRIPSSDAGGPSKIPFVGWKSLHVPLGQNWESSIFRGIGAEDTFYFVHSYRVEPAVPSHRLAETLYGNSTICAAVQAGNVVGCQFHPEKSGPSGLKLLRNFVELY